MLRIAPEAVVGTVVVKRNLVGEALALTRTKKSSLATTRAAPVPLRTLPWPQFLQILEHRRDLCVRAHIRWCMRAAIRNCETLRRAGGRAFELRPGGRHNIVSNGGMYYERMGFSEPQRICPGGEAAILLGSGRYVSELEDNLRKLLCPNWAIPVVKRAIRAKLALGWDLDADGLEGA